MTPWKRSLPDYGMDMGSEWVKSVRAYGGKRMRLVSSTIGKSLCSPSSENEKSTRSHTKTAFSISDDKVEFHEFNIPVLPKKEWNAALEWQLTQAVPERGTRCCDWTIESSKEGARVFCVAAPRDLVTHLFEEAKSSGLDPRYLETESSALIAVTHYLYSPPKRGVFLIIDLGYSAFRLIFVRDRHVCLRRSLYFGLATVCHQGGSLLGISSQDVEELISKGLGSEGLAPNLAILERILHELLYTLVEELFSSESFLREKIGQEALGQEVVAEIYLCGGGACLTSAVAYLHRHLDDRKVLVLNPFEKIGHPASVTLSAGPLWALSTGLVLRQE